MELLQWLDANKEWFLSGLGVAVFTAGIGYFLNRKKPEPPPSSSQQAGDNAINQQGSNNRLTINLNQPPENKKKAQKST